MASGELGLLANCIASKTLAAQNADWKWFATLPFMASEFNPQEIELDGVKAFWLDVPGLTTASITFRVGRVDDPFPMLGLSHLIEHVVLHEFHERDYDYNGSVSALFTTCFAKGTPEEMKEFLETLSIKLRSINEDQLKHELGVVSIEMAEPPGGPEMIAPIYFYGTEGPARMFQADLLEHTLDTERALAFRDRFFTKANACITIKGPLPANLKLELPVGEHRPAPRVAAHRLATPTWFQADVNEAVISVHGELDAAMFAAFRIFERRLFNELRMVAGVSYDITQSVILVDDKTLHGQISVDFSEAGSESCTKRLIQTTESFFTHGATDLEVERDNLSLERQKDDPENFNELLDLMVESHLLGHVERTFMQTTTVHAVNSTISSLRPALFAVLPSKPVGDFAWNEQAEENHHEPLDGKPFKPVPLPSFMMPRYIVNDTGLSILLKDSVTTIKWSEVQVVLLEDHDNACTVLSRRGDLITFLNEAKGERIMETARNNLDPFLFVDRRDRDAKEKAADKKPDKRKGFGARRPLEKIALVLICTAWLPYFAWTIFNDSEAEAPFVIYLSAFAALILSARAALAAWSSLLKGVKTATLAGVFWLIVAVADLVKYDPPAGEIELGTTVIGAAAIGLAYLIDQNHRGAETQPR